MDFGRLPTVKMTMKEKHCEWTQDIKAARAAQLKTLMKGDSRAASESDRDHGISVFKLKILREIHGSVSSTIINF